MRARGQSKERVLAVGGRMVDSIVPLFERTQHPVERVADGATTLLLTRKMSFRYLVVGHPLPDMEVEELIADLRRACSASPGARLLLATTDEHLESLTGRGDDPLVVGVVSIDRTQEELEGAIERFLETSPRVAESLPVRLAIVGSTTRSCRGETIDLSETGLLVRCRAKLPNGTRVEVELDPSSGGKSIRATAVVVRSLDGEGEGGPGVALQFIDFAGDGRDRLARRIRGVLAEHVG